MKKRLKTGTPPKRKARTKRDKTYSSRTIVREDGGPSPEEGGPSEVLASERASATPLMAVVSRGESIPAPRIARSAEVSAGVAMEGGVEGPLDRLQDWFASVITHPRSVADGVEASAPIQRELGAGTIEELVTPSSRMTALDRLHLYHYAYHARLVECLADDYPTVQYAIGHGAFDTLAKKYIETHPSQNPNLNYFGRSFAEFVRSQTWLDNYAFLSDLARLEWAMVEVLHAPSAPTLSLAGLQQLAPEEWPTIQMSPAPTLRFLELDFPVNDFLQAYRDDKRPPIPKRQWSATAVYRERFTVWRMGFTRPMAGVLSALLRGETLGAALDPLDPTNTSEGDVMLWFREWVSGGFFSAIEWQRSAQRN
jgi:hypothetical protein